MFTCPTPEEGFTGIMVEDYQGGSVWVADHDYASVILSTGEGDTTFEDVLDGQVLETTSPIHTIVACVFDEVATTTTEVVQEPTLPYTGVDAGLSVFGAIALLVGVLLVRYSHHSKP